MQSTSWEMLGWRKHKLESRLLGEISITSDMHPTPVLLPRKSHGWRSLEGCSPWGRWGSDMTEWLHFHFSLSYIGEGNDNPLHCSCLENPREGGTWWAAIYGVAQNRTPLKRLSSSSSIVDLQKIAVKEVYIKYPDRTQYSLLLGGNLLNLYKL